MEFDYRLRHARAATVTATDALSPGKNTLTEQQQVQRREVSGKPLAVASACPVLVLLCCLVLSGCGSVTAVPDGGSLEDGNPGQPTMPPATPQNVHACFGDGRVRISFDPAQGATRYTLYHSTTSPVGHQNPTLVLSGDDIPLPNGTSQFIAVTAANTSGESAPSTEVSGTLTTGPSNAVFATTYANGGGTLRIWDGYSTLANGAAPTRTLSGSATGISAPNSGGIFVDKDFNALYVANRDNGSVRIWPAATANGNMAPVRVVAGNSTTLSFTQGGLWLDTSRDRLYVVDGDKLKIWDHACALNGDVPPTAVISNSIGFTNVRQIVGTGGTTDLLYAANVSVVYVYANLGSVSGAQTIAPTRTLTPGFASPNIEGVALDVQRNLLYVPNYSSTNIYVYANASGLTGTLTATRTITSTGISQLAAPFVSGDTLLIPHDGNGDLWQWANASTLNGNVAVSKTFTVTGTSMSGVFYVP